VNAAPTLVVDRVSVSYDGCPVVSDVTTAVAAGEWVALIGPNGAGKSSLLRAVTHLTPHAGTVSIGGDDLAALSWRERARLIAYIPQKPETPAAMTVFDYTLLGRTPHIGRFGVESENDRRICVDVLARLDLLLLADRPLMTLSGGEVQRAALARALAQEAPVLVMDEPTSALDLGRRVEVLELVDDLRIERSLAVLSVMHDVTLAAQFADRVVLLADGSMVASGSPEDVLKPELLTRCFGGQVRVMTDDTGRLIVVPYRAART
jgi:iron complex transport system ATP-binding protein